MFDCSHYCLPNENHRRTLYQKQCKKQCRIISWDFRVRFVLITSRVSPLRVMRGDSPAIILAACNLKAEVSTKFVGR